MNRVNKFIIKSFFLHQKIGKKEKIEKNKIEKMLKK